MKLPFLRRILFATDFSVSAEAAVAYVLDLGVRAGAEVHVLHVVAGRETYASADNLPVETREDLAVRLRESAVAHFGSFGRDDLEALHLAYELAEGRHPAPAITEHAVRQQADVIVLGTHGRRGLRHLFLGSVAEEVIREAPCPVLVVREQQPPKPVRVARIVAPVDFSEHAGAALAQARQLAALYGASLSLLFVAEEHVVPFFSDTGIPTFTLLKIDPDIVAHAEEALRQLDAKTGGPAVPTTYVVRSGQPALEIADFAAREGAGLIVMATHGLTGVEHGLIGSVTERVVRTGPCPVWTVNPAAAPASGDEPQGEDRT